MKLKKLLLLTLCVCMLLPMLLTACQDSAPDNIEVIPNRPAPTAVYLTLPNDADSETLRQAEILFDGLRAAGYEMVMGNEATHTPELLDTALEICFGALSGEESQTRIKALGDCAWGVQVANGKIYVVASAPFLLASAVEHVLSVDLTGKPSLDMTLAANEKTETLPLQAIFKDNAFSITITGDDSEEGVKDAKTALSKHLQTLTDVKLSSKGSITVKIDLLSTSVKSKFNMYWIKSNENEITISSKTKAGLKKATDTFYQMIRMLSDLEDAKTLQFPKSFTYAAPIYDELPTLPHLSGAVVYDANFDGAYTLIREGANNSIFNDYTKKLEEEGYVLRDTRVVDFEYYSHDEKNYHSSDKDRKNEYRLYTNDDYMVYAYLSGNTAMRVIGASIEEYEAYAAVNADTAQGDGKSFFAMLDIGGKNEGKPGAVYGQGMCLVYKLNDGRFILVDGGQWADDDLAATEVDRLYEWLLAHSDNGKIVIAAWLFTHHHSDHINVTWKFEERYGDRVEIQHFLYNFPSQDYAFNIPGGNIKKDYYSIRFPRMKNFLARYDCLVARTGQVYQFANCTIEILYTHDDFYPRIAKSFNNTCTVFKITIEGKSFLVAGDLEEPGQEHCITQTGSWLESDFLQATHHGYNGLLSFYQYIAGKTPTIALWPLPVGNSVKNLEANLWLKNSAKENVYSFNGIYFLELSEKE